MRLYKPKRLSDSDVEFPTGCGNVSHCCQPVVDPDLQIGGGGGGGRGRGGGGGGGGGGARHPVPERGGALSLKKNFGPSGLSWGQK